MHPLDMNKYNYAKALIKAGVTRELIIKITAISSYQYAQFQREIASAA
ncbi:MAG: hypothetical protein HUK21_07095 [Fibrobacteraceae bacterium]|nr:hypothetical protein [Fibrobacteraceae bacterium]